ncbi:protein FAR-RED IMPAIRED RESPONSE 1-like [Ziziphus jujuba]|uniref:Protein FAR-RED IMPAIRED RESPONSE 1-like n=1 Tax=Ziziphus jujuba TaxID=326968 RepID=A0ABM4ADN4_ZIZJJ|nr:protein FAR-RED IMPAIRED RESPONSE 1-like [Ziziphus jujuba]
MDRGEEEAPIAGSQDGNVNDLQYEANNHHVGDVEISLLSCSNDVDDVYILQVSKNLKPTVGQEFISIDEALEFYIKYLKEAGFSVCKNSSKRRKGTNEVIRKEFVCYKEGESSKKGENIGCVKKDIYNYKAKLGNEMWGQDTELLKEYFLTEQEKDPSFMFEIDAYDKCKLKRCFWSDLVCRRAYGCFGDVMVFDTTYNTNQYGMIFAPLVGVNNHGQTVIFACAFLSDERTESFVRLFELLKKSMPANTPKMIIIDQDPAMTKAVAQSLPNTFHRYCSWYILEKFSIYLNAITYRDFYKDFKHCIWESERPEEFERKWTSIIEKVNLHDNDWLKSIFEVRSRWVPTHVNYVFLAGMSSSQHAESSYAFLKRYFSKKNSLMDFILRFNSALAHQCHVDLSADYVDINEKLVLKLPLEMEKQMAKIYTHKIFFISFKMSCGIA